MDIWNRVDEIFADSLYDDAWNERETSWLIRSDGNIVSLVGCYRQLHGSDQKDRLGSRNGSK